MMTSQGNGHGKDSIDDMHRREYNATVWHGRTWHTHVVVVM